jgi:hypothetical protein
MKILKLLAFPFVFLALKLWELLYAIGEILLFGVSAVVVMILIGSPFAILTLNYLPTPYLLEQSMFYFPDLIQLAVYSLLCFSILLLLTGLFFSICNKGIMENLITFLKDNVRKTKGILRL